MGECAIETVSFRLVDTHLMQFLLAATPEEVETVLPVFDDMPADYPDHRAKLGDAGAALVRERFSAAMTTEEPESWFESMLVGVV